MVVNRTVANSPAPIKVGKTGSLHVDTPQVTPYYCPKEKQFPKLPTIKICPSRYFHILGCPFGGKQFRAYRFLVSHVAAEQSCRMTSGGLVLVFLAPRFVYQNLGIYRFSRDLGLLSYLPLQWHHNTRGRSNFVDASWCNNCQLIMPIAGGAFGHPLW